MSQFSNLEVCRSIDPADYMYNALPEARKSEYFGQAGDVLAQIEKVGKMAGHTFSKGDSILDYGAGYGRIARFFAAYTGKENVVACDVHPGAVDFCREMLGVDGVVVAEPFDEVNFGRQFDWIFAGSVFTHVHAEHWRQILQLFEKSLVSDGCIVMTTAGENVAGMVKNGAFDDIAPGAGRAMYAGFQYGGFGYAQYVIAEKNNKHLGRCIVKPRWLFEFVDRFTSLSVFAYLQRGFWGRQDVYFLQHAALPTRRKKTCGQTDA